MSGSIEEREQALLSLYDEYLVDVRMDHYRKPGIKFVGGDGPLDPHIMLIGEAPGRLENAKRVPFTGRAGINLTNILTDVGIDPYYVYMTNVIKFWPRTKDGKTRTPYDEELLESRDYLLREIEIVNPKIIGLCGYSAIHTIYPKLRSVFKAHGELLDNRFVPLYHPAYVTYNTSKKKMVMGGYEKLREHLKVMLKNTAA